MSCPARTYPFHKPKNHRVPIPRWTLLLPGHVTHVYTTYIGIHQHDDEQETTESVRSAISTIQAWLANSNGPATFESFTQNDDLAAKDVAVWICYWSDGSQRDASLKNLSLSSIHQNLPPSRCSVGLWQESFRTEVSRLETNYSGLDYLPGLARLPGASTVEHTLSAYWGAARDRIPDSAHDLFPRAADSQRPETRPGGLGQHLIGTNHANLVHIRSGQFWENCGQQEADAYETKLEPTLRAGMKYLQDNPEETGAIGIRYIRNEDLPARIGDREQKESCGAGFFANLEDLETWAKTHISHLKIYRGALSHYKEFGDERRFRTWHEVCVIGKDDATFEYINCAPGTGAIGLLPLEAQTAN
ncbi:heme-containing dehydratase protein [Paraphoma chrysanthemicola]|uniref:Heme-containing dehydratase protein n=1 Tax=Paraphoma chrysanthemicola TaxID=798071 RepID=A0A8K0RCD3_9PLEO|nr:heme-containing dehydratase protein [Paraphoma chrysanthemicola]